MCVVDAGLDESPALGIFVLINTSLHTFYLSMWQRLEEGVGSRLRRSAKRSANCRSANSSLPVFFFPRTVCRCLQSVSGSGGSGNYARFPDLLKKPECAASAHRCCFSRQMFETQNRRVRWELLEDPLIHSLIHSLPDSRGLLRSPPASRAALAGQLVSPINMQKQLGLQVATKYAN